jgi:arsenate reductase
VSRPRVLFLCTGNSARSLIAEALLRQLAPEVFDVTSAGTHPKGVNPYTLRVLREAGIDSAGLSSQGVERFTERQFDYVITVCDDAAEACPVFPGNAQRLHWSFPDPAAVADENERLAAFRRTLEGMRARIETFIADSAEPTP